MLFAWFFFVIVAIGSARYFREFKKDYMLMGTRIWFFVSLFVEEKSFDAGFEP